MVPAEHLVRTELRGAIAVVTLDNPPVNAMAGTLLEQLAETLTAIGGNRVVRAAVLTGAGDRVFAAGADIAELDSLPGDPGGARRHAERSRRALKALAGLRQPTIAAIQATALGGGFELALACDFAIADERAQIGLPEVGLGLIPGAGGTQRLSRRIGEARALSWILLGDPHPAEEAVTVGAIDSVCPGGRALEEALELAQRLADLPGGAVQRAKASVRGGAEMPLEQGLELEQEHFLAALGSADAREGLAAFREGRQPSFRHS